MSDPSVRYREILFKRCLHSIATTIAVQFIMLGMFILLINFTVFHPLSWFFSVLGVYFSLYTYIYTLPLMIIITTNGLHLGKLYLQPKVFYPTRFTAFRMNFVKSTTALLLHASDGFLTTWLCSSFLPTEYSSVFISCYNSSYLNPRHVFLLLCGLLTGLYIFVSDHMFKHFELRFPILHCKKYIAVQDTVLSTIFSSFCIIFAPSLLLTIFFVLFRTTFTSHDATCSAENESQTILNVFEMILYVWLICSQIHSRMRMMDKFFSIFLTQPLQFPITMDAVRDNLTLGDALCYDKFPVIQELAALELYNICKIKFAPNRKQIFSVTFPGGHPTNWNSICNQSLNLINDFTEKLVNTIRKASGAEYNTYLPRPKPTATEEAERVLMLQYNETVGIRRMMNQSKPTPPQKPTFVENQCSRVQDVFTQIGETVDDAFQIAIKSIPGYDYLFQERLTSNLVFLLSQIQVIIYVSQALAALCSFSLEEDRYGVVQMDLERIFKTLLRLKITLDSIYNVNLPIQNEIDRIETVSSAAQRSLYRLCSTFGPYLRDVIKDSDDLKHLEHFMSFQDP